MAGNLPVCRSAPQLVRAYETNSVRTVTLADVIERLTPFGTPPPIAGCDRFLTIVDAGLMDVVAGKVKRSLELTELSGVEDLPVPTGGSGKSGAGLDDELERSLIFKFFEVSQLLLACSICSYCWTI